ncbi:uncharacterized protein MONBRDRAFT_9465 [Monosiga brevicollis MX1]|uniref:Uncharacterized protein n=1 Tax=Monosiga brevicollis TaxID=81824 RepID=A9V386_MONBE|nr:uncharacterized protein MONBRDRAFT_9465 [Monosiga brevicollis MX1]EDQ88146.1 predicted protein [Monosiga brevicollis MX1]|eukprot:XP_001747222.1 hypothetical protein [Monosiga brevicollis MX1]
MGTPRLHDAMCSKWCRRLSLALMATIIVNNAAAAPADPVKWTSCPDTPFTVQYQAPTSPDAIPTLTVTPSMSIDVREGETMPQDPIMFALMVTGKDKAHEYLARKSMASFAAQTMRHKVMVVINDSPDYSLVGPPSDWLAATLPNMPESEVSAACVVEIRVEPRKFTLGELRNIGINAVPVQGTWVQWDDDDWHERQYMRLKYDYMVDKHADAITLRTQVRFILEKNSSFAFVLHGGSHTNSHGDLDPPAVSPTGIEGTIMVHKAPTLAPIQYPAESREEDTFYLDTLKAKGFKMVVWEENPVWIYFRLYHGINTWDAKHYMINELPGNNAWCVNHSTRQFGCVDPLSNKLHEVVLSEYHDVARIIDVSGVKAKKHHGMLPIAILLFAGGLGVAYRIARHTPKNAEQ